MCLNVAVDVAKQMNYKVSLVLIRKILSVSFTVRLFWQEQKWSVVSIWILAIDFSFNITRVHSLPNTAAATELTRP